MQELQAARREQAEQATALKRSTGTTLGQHERQLQALQNDVRDLRAEHDAAYVPSLQSAEPRLQSTGRLRRRAMFLAEGPEDEPPSRESAAVDDDSPGYQRYTFT